MITYINLKPLCYSALVVFLCLSSLVHALPLTEDEISREIEKLKDETSTEKVAEREKWNKLNDLIKQKKDLEQKLKKLKESTAKLKTDRFFDFKAYDTIVVDNPLNIGEYLEQLVGALKALESQEETLKNMQNFELERLKVLPTLITKLRTSEPMVNAVPDGTSTEVESLLQRAGNQKALAEIKTLEGEVELYGKKAPFIEKALDELTAVKAKIRTEHKKAAEELEEMNRDSDAKLRSEIASLRATPGLSPMLTNLLVKSEKMLGNLYESNGVKGKLEDANSTVNALETSYSTLVEQYKYAAERIALLEKADLEIDSESRQLLRRQREDLPSGSDLERGLEKFVKGHASNELKILDIRASLEDLPNNVQDFAKRFLGSSSNTKLSEEQVVRIFVIFEITSKSMLKYRNQLTIRLKEAIAWSEKNIQASREYSNFLDTRLLWIASHDSLSRDSFSHEWNSIYKHLHLTRLGEWWSSVVSSTVRNPLGWGIIGAFVIFLICLRSRFTKWACEFHTNARDTTCQRITPTLQGLLVEFAIVLPVFLILACLGWLVHPESCYSDGFKGAAAVYFIFYFTIRLSKKDGFLLSNFKIGEYRNTLLHKVAKWSLPFILPVWTTHKILSHHATVEPGGRLITILALLVTGTVLHKVLRPSNQMFSVKGRVTFRSYFIYSICVVVPCVLIVATVVGYYTTVLLLQEQFIYSIRLVLIVLLGGAIMKRWLLVSRRKYAEKSFNEEDTEEYITATGNDSLSEREVRRQIVSKVTEVSDQSKKLVSVTQSVAIALILIAIWANTLPALKVLNEVQLWTTSVPSSEASEPASSSGASIISSLNVTDSVEQPPSGFRWVTLQNLLGMMVMFVLTYIASKNVPGLLKMTVLDKFNLKTGGAFAVTTGVRYIIIIVGIIWGFNMIGVSWHKVQWLAAAITLGIGFGLQEIFANFVAGLIMLFERPVRIGDLVTIGGVSGRVTKIQMRATTILQFSNKELLVPNKEFITGQLVNWTLSDNVMRAEIPVGIAYGSDTALAKKILYECAVGNDRTLKEPKPDVIFKAFGASSLDFLLRVYVTQADDLIPVQSELHFAIDNGFREADIEIAFPQQDIHIKSVENNIPIDSIVSGLKTPVSSEN